MFMSLSRLIDSVNEKIAGAVRWALLAAVVICAGNALVRYTFNYSSNGWLEIQWYLFAGIVMLGAPIVLKLNEHVRVDLVYGKLKGNGPVYVDLFGLIFFPLPVLSRMAYLSWPPLGRRYVTNEMSSNAGGLIRWPAR